MLIKTLPVGQLETNCYIVTDEKTLQSAIIDPGDESNTILDYIESNSLKPELIFLTHGHFDHFGALEAVREQSGAAVYINEKDAPTGGGQYAMPRFDGLRFYSDGDELTVGGLRFLVYETPGHSAGSVTLKCENALFTGDTLFRDSCGRTDLGGDMNQLLLSLRRLSLLEGDFEVYPGHADSTTLDRERKFNYYINYANENAPKIKD